MTVSKRLHRVHLVCTFLRGCSDSLASPRARSCSLQFIPDLLLTSAIHLQIRRLRHLHKRIARVKPAVEPKGTAEEAPPSATAASAAAEELAIREKAAAAAAEALLHVRARDAHMYSKCCCGC